MNVSQTSGSSAAWMLQRLFQSSGDTTTTSTAESTGRQKLPGADDPKSNAGGPSAPKMSGGTMSVMVSMQMGTPPSASDIASDLVSGLDTNGDGEVSTDEITAAFSAAGLDSTNVASTLSAIDTDKSGTLNTGELTKAISSDMQAHGPKGHKGPPPSGPPPSADEAASSILTAFDSDTDSSLSIDEVLRALGRDSDTDGSVASAFASLDPDGDGQINLAELTTAIQSRMDSSGRNAGYRAYSDTASLAT